MIFDFIINKFFKTKLVKGYPECPDCPDPDPDCTNPCGCDDGGPCPCCGGGGSGPGGGGPTGGFAAGGFAAGEVVDLEAEVATFFEVGADPKPQDLCQKAPPECPGCTVSGSIKQAPGVGFGVQCTRTTDWEFINDIADFFDRWIDAIDQAMED